jgi:hypothetical protein
MKQTTTATQCETDKTAKSESKQIRMARCTMTTVNQPILNPKKARTAADQKTPNPPTRLRTLKPQILISNSLNVRLISSKNVNL